MAKDLWTWISTPKVAEMQNGANVCPPLIAGQLIVAKVEKCGFAGLQTRDDAFF